MGSCLSTSGGDTKPPAQPAKVAPAPTPAKPAAIIKPPPSAALVQPTPTPVTAESAKGPSSSKVKVYIVFYSTYGHIYKLALAEKEGVESVPGVEATLLQACHMHIHPAHCTLQQIPETLPDEVVAKMHGPPKPDVPRVTTAHLEEADGLLLGFPTRYGSPPAQFKAFWDSTGQLWQQGRLVGKTGGFFFSTATQGGGQETTAWTAITQLVHHGIIYIPLGYTAPNGVQFQTETAQGGSPYGAGTLATGDGSRQPTETELAIARHQGKMFAEATNRIARK